MKNHASFESFMMGFSKSWLFITFTTFPDPHMLCVTTLCWRRKKFSESKHFLSLVAAAKLKVFKLAGHGFRKHVNLQKLPKFYDTSVCTVHPFHHSHNFLSVYHVKLLSSRWWLTPLLAKYLGIFLSIGWFQHPVSIKLKSNKRKSTKNFVV